VARRSTLAAGALAIVVGLSACTSLSSGVVVEQSDGISYVRASGDSGWPDTYYSARFAVGADQCLYVVFDDGDPALVILSDGTQVTRDGLERSGGGLVAYGEQVEVLRPSADYFDDPLDGLRGCEISERAGIRFDAKP
jgi:hypothetical protein